MNAIIQWLCPVGLGALIALTAIIAAALLGLAALAWVADHFDLPF